MKVVEVIKKNPIISYIFIGVLIVVVIIICYKAYQSQVLKQQEQPLLISEPVNAKKSLEFPTSLIPVTTSGEGYTISMWMAINDWEYRLGEWKHVLHRGDEEGNIVQPGIWLNPKKNKLSIKFSREDIPTNFKFDEKMIYSSIEDNMDLGKKLFIDIDTDWLKPSDEEMKKYGSKLRIGSFTLGDIKDKCRDDIECKGFSALVNSTTHDAEDDGNKVIIAAFPAENDTKLNPKSENVEDNFFVGSYTKTFDETSLNPSLNEDVVDDKTLSNDIDNVPLGRWFHVAVVVKRRSTEVFIDGRLSSTKTLETNMVENTGNLYVTQNGGFSGSLTQLRYYNSPINHIDIGKIYAAGPEPWQMPDIGNLRNRVKIDIDVDVN